MGRDVTMLIKLSEDERERWKAAAAALGVSTSAMARDAVNERADGVIEMRERLPGAHEVLRELRAAGFDGDDLDAFEWAYDRGVLAVLALWAGDMHEDIAGALEDEWDAFRAELRQTKRDNGPPHRWDIRQAGPVHALWVQICADVDALLSE